MVFGDGETRRRSARNAFLKGSLVREGGEAPSRRLEYFVEVGGMRRRKKRAALAGCKKQKTRKRSET